MNSWENRIVLACASVILFLANTAIVIASAGSNPVPRANPPGLYTGTSNCGFSALDLSVEKMSEQVPLLSHPIMLSDKARADLLEGRIAESREPNSKCKESESYLRRIFERLVSGSKLEEFSSQIPEIKLSFQCSRSNTLPVARASRGRVVLIPSGLPLHAKSEDAIAAVLAHELAHLALRHPERLKKGLSSSPSAISVIRDIKRLHEREADIAGLRILVNAGYDPGAAVDHLKTVDQLALRKQPVARAKARRTGSHDPVQARIALLESQIEACRYRFKPTRTPVSREVRTELRRLRNSDS